MKIRDDCGGTADIFYSKTNPEFLYKITIDPLWTSWLIYCGEVEGKFLGTLRNKAMREHSYNNGIPHVFRVRKYERYCGEVDDYIWEEGHILLSELLDQKPNLRNEAYIVNDYYDGNVLYDPSCDRIIPYDVYRFFMSNVGDGFCYDIFQ